MTSDGGKTWHVVHRARRPVVSVESFHDADYATLDNGRTLTASAATPGYWQPRRSIVFTGYCPKGWHHGFTADLVDTNIETPWSICMGEYRGKERVAFTPWRSHGGYGGISIYGYPSGISGGPDGFGVIWETRGTLYVTRDGGHHWHALPKIARPEADFGDWADADMYPDGTAVVLLSTGGSEQRRLIETTNAGRTWHVIHRWR